MPPISRFEARIARGGLVLAVIAAGVVADPSGAARAALVADPASLVNPFIGTAGAGHVFPGADAPFGMVQWSPDTTSRPYGGGYAHGDAAISGFSLTHLSGAGCRAAGDVPVLPTVGAVEPVATAGFSHSNERASAGFYSVGLDDGIDVRLTATTRTGMARFDFPATKQANLLFKLSSSQAGDSAVRFDVVSRREVSGRVTSGNFCGAGNRYTVFFDMRFSEPFTVSGTFASGSIAPLGRRLSAEASGPARRNAASRSGAPAYHGPLAPAHAPMRTFTGPAGAYVTFDARKTPTVLAKVGLSYFSANGARRNLAAENPGWNFTAARKTAHRAWNVLLDRVELGGGTGAQQREFYTALYHSLLHPNVFSDADGKYRGADGRVHTVDAGHDAFYTNISGWDAYRAQAQLEALVAPDVASDTAQSMLDVYRQTHMLPKWTENGTETFIMVGDPADALLADYHAFGATDFDEEAALSAMVAQASAPNEIRPGLAYLHRPGYLPANAAYGCCNFYGLVATTLEYDTADFAISALAGALGKSPTRQRFLDRAQDWINVVNANSGFAERRRRDGEWGEAFHPGSSAGFVEGDSWEYTSMVPFDVAGVAAVLGSGVLSTRLGESLDGVLEWQEDADLGNEPSVALPWQFDVLGAPYLTQRAVRDVQDRLWTAGPRGIPGNDDLGAMSAWFVWSALGMYPLVPGTSILALGSPMFPSAAIALPSGRTLTVLGKGAADGAPYVRSAAWRGSPWEKASAPPHALTRGGTLSFTLRSTPNRGWATDAGAAPRSIRGDTILPPAARAGLIASGLSSTVCVRAPQADGGAIELAGCDDTVAETWTVGVDGTLRAFGRCAAPQGEEVTDGTPVVLGDCAPSQVNRWSVAADGTLVNGASGTCLDDPGGSLTPGTALDIRACDGSAAERWVPPGMPPRRVGPIHSAVASNVCIGDDQGSAIEGDPVVLDACDGSAAQTWTVAPDGTVQALGGCLQLAPGGSADGTLVQWGTCKGDGAQQWHLMSNGALVNPRSAKCLDDPRSSSAPGTQVEILTCNGSPAQRWVAPPLHPRARPR